MCPSRKSDLNKNMSHLRSLRRNTSREQQYTKQEIDSLLMRTSDTLLDKISSVRLDFLNAVQSCDTGADLYMKNLIYDLEMLTCSSCPELAGGLISEVCDEIGCFHSNSYTFL